MLSPFDNWFMRYVTNFVVTNYIVRNDKVFDFAKAFDKVNHHVLLVKLCHLGIHGNLLRWIRSYLSRRSQLVSVHGYDSEPFLAESGVPQGSNLGPLLFLFFINDLLTRLKSPCLAYADDIKIYRTIKSTDDCQALQADLNTIHTWCEYNLMSLSINKCQYITFTKKKTIICHDYKIDRISLETVSAIRDLGVTLDSELSFRHHYEQIIARAMRMLGFIIRVSKPFKKSKTLIMIFSALVRPTLEYCSSVWQPVYKCHIKRIEMIQMKFVRHISYLAKVRHIIPDYSDRLTHFDLFSLERRRLVADMLMLRKILNGDIDCDLVGGIYLRATGKFTRSQKIFSVPVSNNKIISPLAKMCNLYNSLDIDGLDIFETSAYSLKKLLLHC